MRQPGWLQRGLPARRPHHQQPPGDRPLVYYGVTAEPLREHMLVHRLACEALAEECGIDSRSAYTIGLMRTIGMLVLDRVAERLPRSRLRPWPSGQLPGVGGIVFGLSNSEVAALILTDWHFPPRSSARFASLLCDRDYGIGFACLLTWPDAWWRSRAHPRAIALLGTVAAQTRDRRPRETRFTRPRRAPPVRAAAPSTLIAATISGA